MNPLRIIGLLVLVVGAIFLTLGIVEADNFSNSVSKVFTGDYTESTEKHMLGGGIAVIIGLVLMALPVRDRID